MSKHLITEPGSKTNGSGPKSLASFSEKEFRRLHVIHQVMQKWLTAQEAANALDLSARQVLRIVQRVSAEGEKGVMHRLKGRASNHTYPDGFKVRVLKLYKSKYAHLGPSAARRCLLRSQKIRLNRETLRRWLIAAGLRPARS